MTANMPPPRQPSSGQEEQFPILGALLTSVENLEKTARTLASKEYVEAYVKAEEQRRRTFAKLVIAVGLCFLAMFLLLAFGMFQLQNLGESNQSLNTNSNTNTERINRTVRDCLLPSTPTEYHACYEARIADSKKQVDDAIAELVKLLRQPPE